MCYKIGDHLIVTEYSPMIGKKVVAISNVSGDTLKVKGDASGVFSISVFNVKKDPDFE